MVADTGGVAEDYYGVATARSDTTAQEVRNRLLGYPRIDVNDDVAHSAGELLAAADDRVGGNAGLGTNEASIGAMAVILDDAVLTGDVDDFDALGVPVATY